MCSCSTLASGSFLTLVLHLIYTQFIPNLHLNGVEGEEVADVLVLDHAALHVVELLRQPLRNQAQETVRRASTIRCKRSCPTVWGGG